jgi:uncharacterized membrane protein YhaH (DUF805 family)
MNRKNLICAGAALFLFALLFIFSRPYFKPATGWQDYKGQQYRVETWHSNTPLATDRIRLVLRDKTGALRAASPDGYLRSVDCGWLGKCIIYFYTRETASEVYPLESWVLDWPAATTSATAVTDDFDAPPSGFTAHTRANDYITGNICHTNILTLIFLYLSAQFFALLLVTAMRAQAHRRKFYLALLAGLPAFAGIVNVASGGIFTYEKMLIATAGMSLACAPVWAVCSLYHSILLRNPQKKLKPRIIACAFLALFFVSMPFVQQAMQGPALTDEMLQELQLNTAPDGGE